MRFDFVISAVPFRYFIYPKRRNSGDSVAESGRWSPFFHRQIQAVTARLASCHCKLFSRLGGSIIMSDFARFAQKTARDLTRTITYALVALLRQPSRSYSYPQRDRPYGVGSRGRAA